VIMSPTCSRDHHQAVARYIKTGVPRRIGHHTEIMAVRKNGEPFPRTYPFQFSRADGMLYFTAIVRDLTETKALQERINRAERLAELGRVVAEISHEIKNPLMMIGGFARQLAKENKDERSATKLNIIVNEVQRLEGLLREMRDFYPPATSGPERNRGERTAQGKSKTSSKKTARSEASALSSKRTEKRSLSRETEPGSSRCS